MQTLGEQRVRTQFNPGQSDTVSQIKQNTADLIDLLQRLKNDEVSNSDVMQAVSGEKLRLIALAQTAYEEAAMWAVKAATT